MSARLQALEVLILDCQSTGAKPETASLLEIGWARASTHHASTPTAHLLALPEGESIPRQVARITGISAKTLDGAITPADAWRELGRAAAPLAGQLDSGACPVVIHFARFEEAFLRALHQSGDPERDFPLEIICTHEIARRLLPALPRRGLRALAGYLGLSVPPPRRCAEHVAATAFIWTHLVKLLAEDHGVDTWGGLREWLNTPAPGRAAKRVYPMPRERRLALPDQPGVYRMLRGNGDLLYVGKAKSLHKRVNSYFQKRARVADRTLEMLTQALDLEYTATESAVEAALLESDEIKDRTPPYNVALRTGERAIWYASPSFAEVDTAASAIHPIGPLPDAASALAVGALCSWLLGPGPAGKGDSARDPSPFPGLPDDRAPDPDCLATGVAQFRDAHLRPEDLAADRLPQRLLRLGAELWRVRLDELARAGDDELSAAPDEDDEAAAEEPADREWDPDRVAAALEGVVRRAAHMTRRAHWLCRLSECAVAWKPAEHSGTGARLLVFERGAVAQRGILWNGAPPPVPPGCERRRLVRQRDFDLATYDRLRVLTTELRRLASESAAVVLRFHRSPAMQPGLLARTLPWV